MYRPGLADTLGCKLAPPVARPISGLSGTNAKGEPGLRTNSTPRLSGDRPLSDRRQDGLNRAVFADRIAEILGDLRHGDRLVIGIYGPWGEGKTTVLNLIRVNLVENDAIVLRDFNPWRFTDENEILRGFFSMLADAISKSLSTNVEHFAQKAGSWTRCVRRITKIAGKLWKPAETVDELLDQFGALAAKGDSVGLDELRARVVHHLERSDKRIVLLIDDIDRLDKHETCVLFRLVKACADFPNVCYVLAFDDTAVARAIGERYGGGDETSGHAFLEKIIQLPLRLPPAAKEDLRKLCFERVDQVLDVTGMSLTDSQTREFVLSFSRGAEIRLNTPRAVKRFTNGLMFAVPPLLGETHPVDLLLVEALRAFYPQVYDIVRHNHSDFSGVDDDWPQQTDREPRYVELLDPVLKKMPSEEASAVKALLIDLFPRLAGTFGNSDHDAESLPGWAHERRVRAPEYCPRYFTHSIPNDDLADAEITALIEMASKGDADAVGSRVGSYFSGRKANTAIEKLRAATTSVDHRACEILVVAIAMHASLLPNPLSLYEAAEPPSQAAILISQLLQRIVDRAERVAVMKKVLAAADPLWFGLECLRWSYVTDEPEEQTTNTLTKQEIEEVHQVVVDRIKSRASKGMPLFDVNVCQERNLLVAWRQAEGREPVQAHLVGVFEHDPKQVSRFLQCHAATAWGWEGGPPSIDGLREGDLKNIDFLIDLNTMAEWVRKCCHGNFDEPAWHFDESTSVDQRLAEQFIFVLNNLEQPAHSSTASSVNDDSPGK